MSKTMRLHADNATAELKNQNCCEACSWLIPRQLFKEMLVTMYRVGQSHGDIDQRFSEVRGVLADASKLQTPCDILTALEKVKVRENRTLNLAQVHASVDFPAFFGQLDVSISGHTQTKAKTERGEEGAKGLASKSLCKHRAICRWALAASPASRQYA